MPHFLCFSAFVTLLTLAEPTGGVQHVVTEGQKDFFQMAFFNVKLRRVSDLALDALLTFSASWVTGGLTVPASADEKCEEFQKICQYGRLRR